MSAAAGQDRRASAPDCSETEDGQSVFWVWFAVGVLIFTGTDHLIEGVILTVSPDWLTNLTTAI